MHYYNHGMTDGWSGYGYSAWDWLFMFLMMLAFIVIAVAAVRYFIREWHSGASHESALDVLKKRYAKGEIDKQEYEEKKKELKSL